MELNFSGVVRGEVSWLDGVFGKDVSLFRLVRESKAGDLIALSLKFSCAEISFNDYWVDFDSDWDVEVAVGELLHYCPLPTFTLA